MKTALVFFAITTTTVFAQTDWRLTAADTQDIVFGVAAEGFDAPEESESKTFTPASVTKLFTAAVAQEVLGDNHVFRTQVGWTGNGVVRDLTIVADGDPFTATTNGAPETWMKSRFSEIASRMKAAGVTRVTGKLILKSVDERLDDASIPAGTDLEEVANCWGAMALAFNVRGNCAYLGIYRSGRTQWSDTLITFPVDADTRQGDADAIRVRPVYDNRRAVTEWRLSGTWKEPGTSVPQDRPVSSSHLPVSDTQEWFAAHLLRELQAQGIQTNGVNVETGSGTIASPRFTITSASWSETRTTMVKDSEAFLADAYFKAVGLKSERNGSLRQAASEVTSEKVSEWLESVDSGDLQRQVRIGDGPGMTSRNQVSASAMVAVLQAWEKARWFNSFYASMAVAGQDGTLAQRFQGSPAAGKVRAKTGTLNTASNLVGYVPRIRNGRTQSWVAFAIFTESARANRDRARLLQEKIVTRLYRLVNP
jgi:D-alanyl-D-alanine carboxypeptidase/D-alanyl-D-alanine-endopeptidase (penicillin-binding protein 4)